ncbi:endonuclease domain-containing protein [Steroidobacter sp.]|uniref:endonuclease domain-containing protein n=1 Tax=Steroidobacter sp. TaxID=1978227 RepID=UPI0032C22924
MRASQHGSTNVTKESPTDAREFARTLRANSTEAEQRLWANLRNRRLAGFKFRRQQPLGPYIVDFVCVERKLIVEADGGQHADRREYDDARSEYLERRGYRVLRFWNNDVLLETEAVLEVILKGLLDPSPEPLPQAPSPRPSPQGERGKGVRVEASASPQRERGKGGES